MANIPSDTAASIERQLHYLRAHGPPDEPEIAIPWYGGFELGAMAGGSRRDRERRALAAARRAGYPHCDDAMIDEYGRLWVYFSSGPHDWNIIGACTVCKVKKGLKAEHYIGYEAGTLCGECGAK